MHRALAKGMGFVRLAVLLFAVFSLGSCGGGGGGDGGSAGGKFYLAVSVPLSNAAIASVDNPNPTPGNLAADRTIQGTSSNAVINNIPAILIDAARDQLYVSNETSIVVFNNARFANGPVNYNRRVASLAILGGGNFNSLQLDSTRDTLYVGDVVAGVRVYHGASTANEAGGPDRAPDRTISSASFGTDFRVRDVAIDQANDILYVAVVTNAPSLAMSIFVFNNASGLNSNALTPDRTITITTSVFGTMGLFLDTAHDRLYVADSGGDVFVYESAHNQAGSPPPNKTIILPSTVTKITVDTVNDRLYAAGGQTAFYIVPGVSTAFGAVAATAGLTPPGSSFTAVAIRL
jgi:hypothetical protein